jgi:hypothetical protein
MQMTQKGNVVLYLKKELGFNLSETSENHLKHPITQVAHVLLCNRSCTSRDHSSGKDGAESHHSIFEDREKAGRRAREASKQTTKSKLAKKYEQ